MTNQIDDKPKGDASQLAQRMLEYEKLYLQLKDLESEISTDVMLLEKTQSVGNVKASYFGGRKTYDYKEAIDEHPSVSTATIRLFTTTKEVIKIDYKKICEHAGIEKAEIEFTQSAPSVRIKIETND